MISAMLCFVVPHGVSLFFFTTRDQQRQSNPLALAWLDGGGREVRLI